MKMIDVVAQREKRAEAKGLRESLIKIAGLTTKAVDSLRGAVKALMTDIDAAEKKGAEVNELEHEVDLIELGLLKDIYEFEKVLDPVSVVQLVEITRRTENIADRAEDASDMIRIVGYSIRV